MAVERPSSFRSSSNSGRRASSSSFQLPPLPPSTDSLTAGTSIPAPASSPAPMPPPKDPAPLPMPITPKRKPVLRQKSPLSNEAYFSSPSSSMPGAFPTTPPVSAPSTSMPPPQITTTAYASTPSPSSDQKSSKRPSSVRKLLSFRALRRASNSNSPDSSGFRPSSPGTESLTLSQPSLIKKRSGSFWRRNSSMGMTFGKEGEDNVSVPGRSTMNGETVLEDEGEGRAPTPAPGSDFPTMKKRKSGTFWRRKSSWGMGTALGEDGTGAGPNQSIIGATSPNTNGGHSVINRGRGEDVTINSQEDERSPSDAELETPRVESIRSASPPPQIPDFIGAGGGLGGEDLFKDIH